MIPSAMADYLHYRFTGLSREQQEILMAQLGQWGFEGFEEGKDYLSAFVPAQQLDESAFVQWAEEENLTMEKEILQERNWNEEWEKNFEPVVIGSFCAIRASFHAPIFHAQHEIIITPKMSFGTGHHATTRIMVEYMEKLDLNGKTVLDFGTGTGILAILAEKCGAQQVTAIDNDRWSIENAAENTVVNQCSRIQLLQADSLEQFGTYDIILANINRHVILANMAALKQHLRPGGVCIISGLLKEDEPVIEAAAREHQLSIQQQVSCNNWIGLLLQ